VLPASPPSRNEPSRQFIVRLAAAPAQGSCSSEQEASEKQRSNRRSGERDGEPSDDHSRMISRASGSDTLVRSLPKPSYGYVTVFGAWKSATGRAELDGLFSALEETFSGCESFRFDVVAAEVSGDVAYTVGRAQASGRHGEPRIYTLRETQIYRRESGEGNVVRRHGSDVLVDA
jgi:hypothetical protein